MTSKDGKAYLAVTWPKYKVGDEVVREAPSPPTYCMYSRIWCIYLIILFYHSGDECIGGYTLEAINVHYSNALTSLMMGSYFEYFKKTTACKKTEKLDDEEVLILSESDILAIVE